MKRFANKEEMDPLITLCRGGHFFAVQEWISEGNPINPPHPEPKKRRWPGPLEESIDVGFHDMVLILLEAGANTIELHNYEYGEFCALDHAVSKKRVDMIETLINHGANPKDVYMPSVFDTWDPEIMSFFIEHGADVVTGNPLAYAFESKIRTALGIYKKYESQIPDWERQINIALRYHTKTQNQKWASLLLWAGADPFEPGPECSELEEESDHGRCALEIAIVYQLDWFLKKIPDFSLGKNNSFKLLYSACAYGSPEIVERMISDGFAKELSRTKQSELLGILIAHSTWNLSIARSSHKDDFLTNGSLESLMQTGLKWEPRNESLKSIRRDLLKLGSHRFSHLIGLLKLYRVSSDDVLYELTRTATAQALLYRGKQ